MKSTEMEIEQFFIMICYFYADHLQTVKICDMENKKKLSNSQLIWRKTNDVPNKMDRK